MSALVAGGCNIAIGGQGQSGCMRPVCCRSLSELQISVRTKLKDAAILSLLGLVKEVLPSRDSCWVASAIGAGASLSPGEGRTALQAIVLPRIRRSSNGSSGSSAATAALNQLPKRGSSSSNKQ